MQTKTARAAAPQELHRKPCCSERSSRGNDFGTMTFRSTLQRAIGNRNVGSMLGGQILQKKCACGGPCATGGACHDELERRSDLPGIVHEALREPGQRLDATTRAAVEPLFGRDFADVRVHTDSMAAKSARAVNALAYTVGSDVVVDDRYPVDSIEGRRVIAHELAHVVQQASGGVASANTGAFEIEAEEAADAVTRGEAAGRIGAVRHGALQRQTAFVSESDPSRLSDRGLIDEYRRVLAVSDPATGDYFLALDAEVKQRFSVAYSHGTPVRPSAFHTISAGDVAPLAGFVAPLTPAGELAAAQFTQRTLLALRGGATAETLLAAGATETALAAGATETALAAGATETALATGATGGVTATTGGGLAAAGPWLVLLLPFVLAGDTPQPRSQTQPRVQADQDVDEDDRGGCYGRAIAQRGGNTCHDQFATSVSGVSREWGVTTPEGMFESYDALGRDRNTLFEIKTGYRFLLGNQPDTQRLRDATIMRFIDQASVQTVVAMKCGYNLLWVFNDRQVAELVSGFIEPPVVFRPFDCDMDQ